MERPRGRPGGLLEAVSNIRQCDGLPGSQGRARRGPRSPGQGEQAPGFTFVSVNIDPPIIDLPF